MFRANQVGILMPIVNDFMASLGHHLSEFNDFLSVRAGIELFARYGVRKS